MSETKPTARTRYTLTERGHRAAHHHWTYPAALRAIGRTLTQLPHLHAPAITPAYWPTPHIADILIGSLHQITEWARAMSDILAVQLATQADGSVQIRLTGRLDGPLVQVTTVTRGLPLDIDGTREITVQELAALTEDTVTP